MLAVLKSVEYNNVCLKLDGKLGFGRARIDEQSRKRVDCIKSGGSFDQITIDRAPQRYDIDCGVAHLEEINNYLTRKDLSWHE